MGEPNKENSKEENPEKSRTPPIHEFEVKFPSLPKVKPPNVNIRPNVQTIIDNLIPSLTEHEIQYLIQKVRLFINSGVKINRPQMDNPVYKELTDGLKELEDVVTVSYPKFFVPPTEANNNDTLNAILNLVKPLFESPKVQDQFARILAALADKLEGKG